MRMYLRKEFQLLLAMNAPTVLAFLLSAPPFIDDESEYIVPHISTKLQCEII
jgi:hypothetical protein